MQEDAKCNKCGHTWKKRTENPIECPRCTTRLWNRTRLKPGPRPTTIYKEAKPEQVEKKPVINFD